MLSSVLCVPRPPCRPLPASPKLSCPRALLGGRDTSEAPPTLPSYLSWGPLGGDSCFPVCPAWGRATAPGSHQSQTLGSAAPSTLVWVGGPRGQSAAVEPQEDCLSRGCHRRLGSMSKGGSSPNQEGQQHDHPEHYIPARARLWAMGARVWLVSKPPQCPPTGGGLKACPAGALSLRLLEGAWEASQTPGSGTESSHWCY